MFRRFVESRCKSTLWVAVLLLFLFPAFLVAQEGVTAGSLSGTVTDAAGAPLVNAEVTVRHVERGTERTVLTTEAGRFAVGLLSPGLYEVRAEMPPLEPVTVRNIRVSAGERTTVRVTLDPVEALEIEVAVGARDIARAEGGVVDLVDEQQIQNLPTAGRDFTDFINLSALVSPQPEVTTGGQFSIGGARGSGTNVQIDGADANNAFFGENRGGARLPFSFSLESIQEFQLITSGYDVEHGKFSGGIVNAVTRGGTNEFRGSAHLFWRDEALTTENFDGTPATDFEAFQFGGTASGPIVRDQLHFFVSGDFQLWDQPVFALDPDRANISPELQGEFRSILEEEYGFDRSFLDDQFGVFTETKDQVSLFGRLDWTINPDHRLSVRVNYSDFESLNDRISFDQARTLGGTFEDEVISVVTELNSAITDNIFNTFRFQYSDEERPRPGNSQFPTLHVTGEGVETVDGRTTDMFFGGEFFGITFANLLEEEKFEFTNNLNFRLGDHMLKVGGDLLISNTFNMFWLNGNGWFLYTGGMDAFREGDPLFFLRFVTDLDDPQAPVAPFNNHEWAFYVQNQWQATDDLLITAGLRYDFNNWRTPGEELAREDFRESVEAFGLSSTTVPRDRDNVGPRLSFTWDMEGDDTQVLRGGAGVFYDRTPTVTHSNVMLTNPDPVLAVFCLFPDGDIIRENFRNWDSPGAIPTREEDLDALFCSEDAPEIAVWDEDHQDPTTYKANLGYEHQLGDRWRASVEGIFTRTTNLFAVQDANLPAVEDAAFNLPDGRPVFLDRESYADAGGPQGTDADDVFIDPDLRRLFVHTDNADARAWNFKFDIMGEPIDGLRIAANYAYNRAFDNSTTSCCTAHALMFNVPTAGSPNELGEVGDRDFGAWGPSSNERRHAFVTNAIWELPADFQASFIYRVQSGNPFTPSVSGDLNADGESGNNRPFLPDPDNPEAGGYTFATEDDREAYRGFLAEHGCLEEAVGTIINRNTCRNPAWHSLDIKLQKAFRVAGGHRLEVIADLFNVLDGLGLGAGEFNFRTSTLFRATEFDADTDIITLETADFAREIPVGFEPFQFRAQLGVRYRF